jgi:spore maturation protein CgeB
MKILFVAELRDESRAKQRLLALKDLEHEVLGFSSVVGSVNQTNKPTLWQRMRWKVGYPVDTVNLNQLLSESAQDFSPDLIWIEKVQTLYPSTYKQLRQLLPKAKIVLYSEDDIFMRHNRSIYLQQSLPLFDVVFTTKPRNLQELPHLGAKRVFCIYQAYDRNLHRPITLTLDEQAQWGSDVSFIGTFERDRAEKMLYLAEQGVSVRVWGSNWQKWRKQHPNLRIEQRPVYNDDFIKVICGSKINLNFLRKANRDRHTSRSLEIPACEAFMLAEKTDEHLQLFQEGKEAEFFNSREELLRKVQYYLDHDEKRISISVAGRQKCLDSGYSHHDRLKVMLIQVDHLTSI